MSDRCNKTRKLSAKKAKHRRCNFKMSKTNGGGTGAGGSNGSANDGSDCAAITKNQMASSMQQFCIDSNIMVNTARKCSFSGKKKQYLKRQNGWVIALITYQSTAIPFNT